jgi:hypothetical protein
VDFGDPADFPLWCAIYDSLGAVGVLSAGATLLYGIDAKMVRRMESELKERKSTESTGEAVATV